MKPRPSGIHSLPRTIKQLLQDKNAVSTSLTTVTGHIRSIRRQKHLTFALVEDGSSATGLQAVFRHGPSPMMEKLKELSFGAAVRLTGRLVQSKGPGQDVELVLDPTDTTDEQGIEVVGKCDPNTYPLQAHQDGEGHSVEFLRDLLHLRLRTPAMQNAMRLRSKAKEALEVFLSTEQDFTYVHTPVLTGIDAEGGGEAFRLAKVEKTEGGDNETETEEFFGKPVHLTVSSQLHLEAFQAALGRVYTLAPCFRAEPSMTGRHLSEFWMLECEWGNTADIESADQDTFSSQDLHGLCTFVEGMLRHTVSSVLPHLEDGHPHSEELRDVAEGKRWARVTYSEAVAILQKAEEEYASAHSSSSSLFEFPPALGATLQSEHEKYLAEVFFKGPVFVMDYPKKLKPFYMRLNPGRVDNAMETVACFDLLVPRVGELVGGSVREERYDVLKKNMEETGLIPMLSPDLQSSSTSTETENNADSPPSNPYEWYLDLRQHGSMPHGGFGMGFERLILWLGGAENIREVLGMPRWKGRMGM